MADAWHDGQTMEAIKSTQDELKQIKQEYKQEKANLDVRRMHTTDRPRAFALACVGLTRWQRVWTRGARLNGLISKTESARLKLAGQGAKSQARDRRETAPVRQLSSAADQPPREISGSVSSLAQRLERSHLFVRLVIVHILPPTHLSSPCM